MREPDDLFPFPAERTAFSDEFYAALGRAVAFCAHFEHNCTVLATTLELRVFQQQRGVPPQDVIDQVVEEMAKPRLARILNTAWKTLQVSEQNRKVFDDARDARNLIVHALAIDIQQDVESSAGRQERLADLREAIGRVARADLLACLVSEFLITGKEPRLPSFASSYPANRLLGLRRRGRAVNLRPTPIQYTDGLRSRRARWRAR
jgi:hypothetical protein